MNVRLAIAVGLTAAVAGLLVLELRERRAGDVREAVRAEVAERRAAVARQESDVARDLEALRVRVEASRKAAAARAAIVAPPAVKPASNASSGGQMPAIANNEELRKLRVTAFVGEERLRYAAVLRQLQLSPEQLAAFDRIEAEYQEGALDVIGTAQAQGLTRAADLASLRREVFDARAEKLRGLLGEGYSAWEEASRNSGVRDAVDELLQKTFQSGGPANPAQTRALAELVQRHARAKGGSLDWEAAAAEAARIFSGAQLEAVQTALHARGLAEQMAVAAGGREGAAK